MWEINLHGKEGKYELDRALANDGWNEKFGAAMVEHMYYYPSDHRPLLVNLDPIADVPAGTRVLHFESKWLKEARFQEMVAAAWADANNSATGDSLASRIAFVHAQLHTWHKTVLK